MSQNQTQQMNKHKFNIFPAAKAEDYNRLKDDIRDNGYDSKQPVIIYEGQVLDGWNRWTACVELKINPPTRLFDGNESEAIGLVMRTNKRRNLNSGQWATIAVEADDIIKAIAQDGKARQIRKPSDSVTQEFALQTKDQRTTSHKAAELFNTNRTYVNQAAKIKQAAPEVFERVKAGKMTMQDAARAVRAIPTEPWLDDWRINTLRPKFAKMHAKHEIISEINPIFVVEDNPNEVISLRDNGINCYLRKAWYNKQFWNDLPCIDSLYELEI